MKQHYDEQANLATGKALAAVLDRKESAKVFQAEAAAAKLEVDAGRRKAAADAMSDAAAYLKAPKSLVPDPNESLLVEQCLRDAEMREEYLRVSTAAPIAASTSIVWP